jgi:hypothetical protein
MEPEGLYCIQKSPPTVPMLSNTKISGQYIQQLSFSLAENKMDLCYKDQPVNALLRNNRCLVWKLCETHKYVVWKKCKVVLFNVERCGKCSDHRAIEGL